MPGILAALALISLPFSSTLFAVFALLAIINHYACCSGNRFGAPTGDSQWTSMREEEQ